MEKENDVNRRRKYWKRFGAFSKANGIVVFISVGCNFILRLTEKYPKSTIVTVLAHTSTSVVRFACLILIFTWSGSNKRSIGGVDRTKGPNSQHIGALLFRGLLVAFVEAMGFLAASRYLIHPESNASKLSLLQRYITFVQKSFLFEIMFDFCHYWMHRLCHQVPSLYQFHKAHHKFLHPSPLSTVQQSVGEVLITNLLPSLTALSIMHRMGPNISFDDFEFSLMRTYKVFVEVAGHIGIETSATSFPQCMMLPRMLGIELKTNDHDLHHSHPQLSCNYSKRFKLWDLVFNTYKRL
jgi:sterol desaturase/sphingolipid hydroxylase (fatty acid hydroxylase superfamily)